jgi:RNA polymerase sigma factor (sigma-70 family)
MTSNLARIEPKSGDIRQVVERRAHRMLEARIRFVDLISEGTVALIQASERFDCRRGARFSTYATWAIHNNFVRRINSDRSRRVRFATGREKLLQALTDYRASGQADAMDQEQSQYMIQRMLEHVGAREQTILALRFGLAGDKQTLRQVGQELGISKERVRQLETRAMNKLRTFAKVQQLYPVDQSALSSPCCEWLLKRWGDLMRQLYSDELWLSGDAFKMLRLMGKHVAHGDRRS